jgi:hypothetical protein
MFLTQKARKEIIEQAKREIIGEIHTLDPEKSYILILPPDVDQGEVASEVRRLRGKQNLLVILADKAHLLELI